MGPLELAMNVSIGQEPRRFLLEALEILPSVGRNADLRAIAEDLEIADHDFALRLGRRPRGGRRPGGCAAQANRDALIALREDFRASLLSPLHGRELER